MTEEVKEKIAEAAMKVAEYIHDGNFEGLIVSGGSNKVSRSLLALAWQSRYKGETIPHLYVFDKTANNILYKDDDTDFDEALPEEFRLELIKKYLPELQGIKSKKICYVDDFSSTGQKHKALQYWFEKLGLQDISFAFFGSVNEFKPTDKVFVGGVDFETARALKDLALEIQGRLSSDILRSFKMKAEERRINALRSLKEIGQNIRIK